MCLYEMRLKNQKYLPNKKNKGCPPAISDYRQNTINVGCGWCTECRKKIANEWRIRLLEEIKANKGYNFITLSFSPSAIKKLETEMYLKKWRGIENEDGEMETDVNLLAAYAIRMWCERWRKHYKKAPKHWLITELGHKNSERIHLHGLIQGTQEQIEKTWKYGGIYTGEYVNSKTINYIMKYVTKLDEYHKGYKQRIFVSKGLGIDYITRNKKLHKFNGEKTITEYRTYNGIKLGLPRYYKEKLWTEKERELLWSIKLDENKIYVDKQEIDTEKIDVEKFDKILEGARKRNESAGYGNNLTGNKKFIITELMKLNKNEIIDYNRQKIVKAVERRNIDRIEEEKNTDEITKAKNKDNIYYYTYKGTTTEAERNYNELLIDAKTLGISVRKLRLIKEGILTWNSQIATDFEQDEMLITMLKKKYKPNKKE